MEEDGTVYEEGDDTPDPDPCKTCRCKDGEKVCAEIQCDIPQCGRGYEARVIPGQCCPSCQRSEYYTILACRNYVYYSG